MITQEAINAAQAIAARRVAQEDLRASLLVGVPAYVLVIA